ncbi:MAG: helix-turn-helix transcriptional regulator [Candidatus Micrarchaeaceae archaeon]
MAKRNFIDTDMKATVLKIGILRHMLNKSVNSYTILKDFSSSRRFARYIDKNDMKNEIYNTINSLENSGYIKSSKKIENGRLKNYYKLTSKGTSTLKSAGRLFRVHIKALKALLSE